MLRATRATRASIEERPARAAASPAPRWPAPVLVDAHVHLHRCFELRTFLDAAADNVATAGRRLGLLPPPLGVLLLAERSGDDFFGRLWRSMGREIVPGWIVEETGEESSVLVAERGGEPRLVIVAGRQIAAREGLEVLALGSDRSFADGRPFDETLESVIASGAMAVVPWGFGKWWGRRGRRVRWALDRHRPGELFLGDNGGRLAGGPRPRLFAEAEARGFRVLPGSDPLPFPPEAVRAGSFGFVLDAPLERRSPAAALASLLGQRAAAVRPYGAASRLVPFVRNQVAMQLAVRRRGGSP